MIGSSGLRLRGTSHHNWTTSSRRRRVRISTICSYSRPDLTTHYAVLGLTPFASKSDVKQAYKRLALKYHPDVYKGEDGHGPAKDNKAAAFTEIKSAYEDIPLFVSRGREVRSVGFSCCWQKCLMQKFDKDELQTGNDFDEYDDWEEWMGFEGGIPVIHNPF
ncbi:hypothetical protein PTKIN_Ptkin09bG0078300 [Pterospermum kingtungense]